jgi:hypothetical protein
MKQQIEETLQCLIGHLFWGAGRSANLLTFQFGPRHWKTHRWGKAHEVGTYALHVQCAWHLAQMSRLLAASGDRGCEPSEEYEERMQHAPGEAYVWPKTESTLLDERLLHFFLQCQISPVQVLALRADDLGSLTLELSNEQRLAVFPDSSLNAEYWRFFQVGADLPHFVVTGQGIEEQ